ncbi:hypothetical protein HDU85_005012 [Gaertneriomyces sp. JEL0708]|nr:hypothetical protein HDU85_005012 [Gaertneriomyces sp. JEL0708]
MADDATAIAKEAKLAALLLQSASNDQKNIALQRFHDILKERKNDILAANQLDLEAAKAEVEQGTLSSSLFSRLALTEEKYSALLQGVLDVARLADPTGRVTLATHLDKNLDLFRISCPVGVLLIIFEARPEVVVQISCLAIKSGNAVILKGGKEASHSNKALYQALQYALSTLTEDVKHTIAPAAVSLVSTRSQINSLLSQDAYIDLVIPRGSKQLIQYVQSNTRIPVLGHADGICSVYVHEDADLAIAASVVVDSKCNYPAACNAVETLIVHKNALERVLPGVAKALLEKGVELYCDKESLELLQSSPDLDQYAKSLLASTPESYQTEYLTLALSVLTVASLEEAMTHINTHGSHHTDAIVTASAQTADVFMSRVDSAGVYHNASTRFADGFRYGFGAEIGVSTNKTHARGPVGLEGLVIYKYRLYGKGQGAGDYGQGKRKFLHGILEGVESVDDLRKTPKRSRKD